MFMTLIWLPSFDFLSHLQNVDGRFNSLGGQLGGLNNIHPP